MNRITTRGKQTMTICYLCNGMEELNKHCPACENNMMDAGKAVDYHGDYAPYIEAEDAKLIDGIADSSNKKQCIHLAVCSICNYDEEIVVQERM